MPNDEADQLLVQPHVAVQDVAELVRDDALKLGALEVLERAARHGDRRVGAREPGGECIDAGFLLEHVDLRHGQPRRERHLLDDVHEAPLERVVAFAVDARARRACERRGRRRARASPRDTGSRATISAERADGDPDHEPAMAVEPLPPVLRAEEQRVVLGIQAQARDDDDRRRERDEDEREQEHADERTARAARLLLAREEVHGRRAASAVQLNETFGTARFSASPISRYSAVLKPKLFAIRLPGKFWQALL